LKENINELVRSEQLQDHKVGITGVFEIVRCVGGNVSDIVSVVVHCVGVIYRKEHRHATVAGDIVGLPHFWWKSGGALRSESSKR
jgi:hypothetical protein